MASLAPEQAPPATTPRCFLYGVPAWGAIAALLLATGEDALASRWQPLTLALTHACTLGVLGNAMFGSLLQFLPAAAGVRLRGGARATHLMHALLNGGTALLVGGFLVMSPRWLGVAALLLLGAFALLLAICLPGLLAERPRDLLRSGLALAIGCGAVTAVLGGTAVLVLGGWLALPLPWLVDTHAAWGTLGWVLLLLVVVAREVMPMFQGCARVSARAQIAVVCGVPCALLAGSLPALHYGEVGLLQATLVFAATLFAVTGLYLQWRARRTRNAALRAGWRVGLCMLLAAALALAGGARGGVLAGVLGIGIAAPLLVTGMLLEIVAFIGWIDLHRRCGRGVQAPGVQTLLAPARKQTIVRTMCVAALVLIAAALWPLRALALLAGLAWLLAWAQVAWAMAGVQRRADAFLRARAA